LYVKTGERSEKSQRSEGNLLESKEGKIQQLLLGENGHTRKQSVRKVTHIQRKAPPGRPDE